MDLRPPAIVAVNAHAADPHYAPTAEQHAPIQPRRHGADRPVGAETNAPHDCFADITWVGYCGAEAPAKAREVFAVVAAGRDAAVRLDARTPGRNGATVYGYEVDDACRGVIEATRATATPFSTAPVTAWASRPTTTASTSTTYETQRSPQPDAGVSCSPSSRASTCPLRLRRLRAQSGAGHAQRDQLPGDGGSVVEVTTLPLQTEIVTFM
jgi:hypothetical protein